MPLFDRNKSKLNFYVDGILICLAISSLNFVLLGFLYCLMYPKDLIFIGQLIPHQLYFYIPFGLIVAAYHGYLLAVNYIIICSTASMQIVYLMYLTFFITNLRINSKKAYQTDHLLRQPQNLRIVYRSLQILHNNFLCFMGIYWFLFYCMFYTIPIIVNVLLLNHWNQLSRIMVVLLGFGGFSTVLFSMVYSEIGKYLWVQGNKNFDSWAKKEFNVSKFEKKVMRKFCRSLKPILLRHGNSFVIGRITQFIYVKSLILYTFKALIAFK